MVSDYREWDETYRNYPLEELGWELGKPRPILVEHIESGIIPKGKALDTCCGVGTNPIYLAQNGFEVTGIDISLTAIDRAKKRSKRLNVDIDFVNESFVDLSFKNEVFDFIFDMGCFHHVGVEDRPKFIEGVHRVLKKGGVYMLTAFSYRNGAGWNHFRKQQLIDLFHTYFEFGEIRHYPSFEGDGAIRFFYSLLMRKKT